MCATISSGRRHGRGVVDHLDRAVRELDAVLDVRRGRDERQVVLASEALADDLHVEQPEEAAAEPEAERPGGLGLVGERRVVEAEALERLAQARVLVAVDGVEAAEHHRLRVEVPLEGRRGMHRRGDGLPHPRLADVLDPQR